MASIQPLRLRTRSQIVIPARLHSTRLPRKLLLRETGKTILQHTYEAALQAQRPQDVWVAADHDEIVTEVRRFGGKVTRTDPNARSGSDRVAEVARGRDDIEIFVNVQGDEPEISAAAIDEVIGLLEQHPQAAMSTLATPIRNAQQWTDPACVKVVRGAGGAALYFSRSPIPAVRDAAPDWDASPTPFLQHLGLYAYRRSFLLQWPQLPVGKLEQLENLEQLRVLEAGYSIQVGVVDGAAGGIDTAEDYRAFVTRYRSC